MTALFTIKDEVEHAEAKEQLSDIDLSIRHEEAIRSRSSLIWDAITPQMRNVHNRYLRALKTKQKRLEDLLEACTCQGCGEYYDEFDTYNTTHADNDCRKQAYRNGKDSEDSRV